MMGHHALHAGQEHHQDYNYYNSSSMYSVGEEWAEFARIPSPHAASVHEEVASTAVAFDQCHEMLWIGYSNGRLTSHLLPGAERYTSVMSNVGAIKQIVPTYEGVVAVSDRMAVVRSRGCVQSHVIAAESPKSISSCRLNYPDPLKPSEYILVGMSSGKLKAFDLHGYRPLRPTWSLDFYHTPAVLASSPESSLHCAGSSMGQLDFFDGSLRSHRIEASIPNAHGGSIVSMDMLDNYVLTCGVSSRSINPYDKNAPVKVYPDPLIKLFDIRTMSLVSSFPFPSSCGLPPSFVKFHPSLNSFYSSDTDGELMLFDMSNPMQYYSHVCQLNSTVTSWDVALTGELMVSGSAEGTVTLYDAGTSAAPRALLEAPETPLDFPPGRMRPPLTLSPLEPSPASRYLFRPTLNEYGEELTPLSAWLPASLDKSFMHNLTLVVAPKPTKVLLPDFERKIQHKDTIGYTSHRGFDTRNSFLYGKGKSSTLMTVDPRFVESSARHNSSRSAKSFDESDPCHVPPKYKYAEIKVSKFGLDGFVFDFSKHNQTPYVCLENSLPFAYMNSVLQLLYYTPGVRSHVLNHHCSAPSCVSCEMGFLYHMMQQTSSKAHPKNKSCQVTNFLSAFHKIPQVASFGLFDKALSILTRVERMFAFIRDTVTLPFLHFVELSHASLDESTTFQDLLSSNLPSNRSEPPQTVAFACGADKWLNDAAIQNLWSKGDWVQPSIELFGAKYVLLGVISAVIRDTTRSHNISGPNAHLVAHVRTQPSPGDFGEWTLFNDFNVSYTTWGDALDFSAPWKWPCLLLYTLASHTHDSDDGVPVAVPIEVFSTPSLTETSRSVLDAPRQLPQKGDRVAIDTEFVIVEMEEATMQTDGTRIVTKESRQALARVSVIHGETDEVLVDDYIVPNEPVVDYQTRFSGLTAEDLNPSISRHNLVHLKTAYLKLRYLVDAGCIFVGHGLRKDFRIVNIFVPPDQVADTVELYQQPNTRMISLRFLCAYLLKTDIQLDTHDSIEDARAALKLHNKYLSLVEDNEFDKTLMEIYAAGRQCRWKIADLDNVS